MINLNVKDSDVDGLYDVVVVVDSGSCVTGVYPGLMDKVDLVDVLDNLQEQIDTLRVNID